MGKVIIPDNEIWAWNGQLLKPNQEEFETGHTTGATGKKPRHDNFNYLEQRRDLNIQYILRNSLLPWDDKETYSIGAVVLRESAIYECLKTSVNNDPLVSTEYWELLKLAPANHTHNASDINAGTLDNNRLNKASTSQQGIVQTTTSLGSTRSDLAASASAAKALNDKIEGIITGFSSGQTWKSTSSKVFNVNYTNSNPYPIQIYVSVRYQGSTGGTAFLIVDGVNVGWHNAVNTGSGMSNEIFSAIIPPGSVYQVKTPNSDWSKTAWAELY